MLSLDWHIRLVQNKAQSSVFSQEDANRALNLLEIGKDGDTRVVIPHLLETGGVRLEMKTARGSWWLVAEHGPLPEFGVD